MIDIITFLLGWTSGLFVGLAMAGYIQKFIRLRQRRADVALWTDFFVKSGFVKILIDYFIPYRGLRFPRVHVNSPTSSTENPVRQESRDVPPSADENSNSCPRRNTETSSPLADMIFSCFSAIPSASRENPVVDLASFLGVRLPTRSTPTSPTSNTPPTTNNTTSTASNTPTTTPTSPTSNTTTTVPTSPFGNIKPTTPTKNVENPQENSQGVSTSSEEDPKNNPNIPNFY